MLCDVVEQGTALLHAALDKGPAQPAYAFLDGSAPESGHVHTSTRPHVGLRFQLAPTEGQSRESRRRQEQDSGRADAPKACTTHAGLASHRGGSGMGASVRTWWRRWQTTPGRASGARQPARQPARTKLWCETRGTAGRVPDTCVERSFQHPVRDASARPICTSGALVPPGPWRRARPAWAALCQSSLDTALLLATRFIRTPCPACPPPHHSQKLAMS